MQKSSDVVVVDGEVTENLPNTLFRVKLINGKELICYVAGKMRRNYIRLLPGDRVRLEITAYDPNRGRIIYRS